MVASYKEFVATIDCGASVSNSFIDFGVPFEHIMVSFPTLTSSTDLSIQGKSLIQNIWRDIYHDNGDGSQDVSLIKSGISGGGQVLVENATRFIRPRINPVVLNTEIIVVFMCTNHD